MNLRTLLERVALPLICSLALAVPAAAQSRVSDRPTLVVFDCAKDTLALRFTSAAKPLAVRTTGIAASGGTASYAIPWTIAWSNPVSTEPAINEYEVVGTVGNRCPTVGRYVVTIKILTGAADGSGDLVDFAVERQSDPSLYVAPQITSTLNTYPFWTRSTSLSAGIQLREESHSNEIAGLTVAPAELRASTGEFVGIQIAPADPKPITLAPGTAQELAMKLTATPPPGIYNARLLLHSPQLNPGVSVDLTLKVQVVSLFLLLILAVGVGLGWVVNVWLSMNATLDAARLDTLRAADGIVARARAQRDPAVQQRLVSLAGDLESKSRLCRTVAELQALLAGIQNSATAIEAQADATLKTFFQDLASTRSLFAPDNLPLDEGVAGCLRVAIENLDRIERLSATGDIEESERQLQSYRRSLPQLVLSALRAWLVSVKSSLDEFGTWGPAAEEPEQSRSALLQNIAAAYSVVDPATMILQAEAIAARLRGWMALTVPPDVVRIFQATATALRTGARPDLAGAVAACANDVAAIHVEDSLAALNSISAIRRRVEDAIRAGSAPSDAVNARLAEGNFVSAAALVAPPPPAALDARPAGPATSVAAANRLPRASLALPAGTVHAAPLRLRLASDLTLGQAAQVGIDWSDTPPAGLSISWDCLPPGAADVPAGASAPSVVTPRKPGFLTIVANIAGYPAISAGSYVGSVVQTTDFKALEKRETLLKSIIWTITAVLTTGVGFEIFVGSWLGTAADFVSAFLWGFFGQFGLDRVRDLARPVTARTMRE